MSATEVRFETTRTKRDYFWAIAWNMLRNGRVWTIYLVSALLIASFAFVVDGPWPVRTFVITFVLMLLLYCAVALLSVYWSAQHNWNAPGALGKFAFELNAAGLKAAHEFGEGQSAWAVWKNFFETKDLIVIRHKLGIIQIVPKRDLNAATADQLRAVLRLYLTAEKKP